MKMKEKLKNIPQIFKKSFEKFPVTIIAILLFSAFNAITIDTKLIDENIGENITFFILYFIPGSFFVESIFHKNEIEKIISYVSVAVISIILVILQKVDLGLSGIEGLLFKVSFCYVVTLYILSVYFLFKKSKMNFNEYVLKVFINVTKISVIYGILAIGISIISSIFVYLIWEKLGYTLVYRLEILLLGFYYIPKLLYCFIDVEAEINGFFKGLIKYVLTSLVMISFVIIYMYIIKILVLRDMPKNQIFRILSALFIVGMPIWTMMHHLKDESFWYKASTKLPIAFIPFILLQIYTIGIRLVNNGFTPLRYACVAFIIFEIVYTLIYIFKKEKLEILLLIFNGMIIISLLVPGINMFKISNISQAQNLKIYKNQSDYTEEEKEKIYGAYMFLKSSEGGEKYIENILEEDDIEEIKSFKKSKTYNKLEETYIQASFNDEKINVEGYSNLYIVNTSNRSIEESIKHIFENIEIKCQSSDYSVYADLSDQFEKYINTYMNFGKEQLQQYLKENNEIEIDHNRKLVIKSFYLYYNQELKLVKNYSIKGYLLEKYENI